MNFRESGFQKIREIGKGGMATVILAKHLELNSLVAVKILNQDAMIDREYIQRFYREARITASLNHPNIVRVIESNFSGGDFYIVTEYINGGDLTPVIYSPQLPLKKKLWIMSKVVNGLGYAHGKGIVHRDIKPSNILMTQAFEPKLCDFGISTMLMGPESRLTQTNQLMGTMDYISPEQREDAKNVDFRTDLFSIGVILYKMATGRKPFGAFKRPIEIDKQVPPELDKLIMKCLQPDPSDRYRNTGNLHQALLQLIKSLDDSIKDPPMRSKNKVIDSTIISDKDFDNLIHQLKQGPLSEKLKAKSLFLQKVHQKHKNRLIELLADAEGILKEVLIESMGILKFTESCDILIELLNDSYYNKFAAKAIGDIGCSNGEASLLRLLNSDTESAYIAIKPLGMLNSKKSIKGIRKFMNHPLHWIRAQVVESLGMIRDDSVLTVLEKMSNGDPDSDVRAKAKHILRRRI